MRTAILCILLCSRLAAQTAASIEGIATDSTTRQPLSRVHIALRTGSENTWGAMTGKDGHFSISNLPPGDYALSAQHTGYIHLPDQNAGTLRSTEIVLKDGEHRSGLVVAMTPRASISGTVTDEYGDPVQNAAVQAVSLIRGDRTEHFETGRTDERGHFRLSAAPGKFLIRVTPQRASPEIRTDGDPPVYTETYYPSAATRDLATVVEVAAGRDLTGIDVRLARTLSLRISGTVTGMPKGTVAMVRVALEDADPGDLRWTNCDPEGRFTIFGLSPGHYRVAALAAQELRSPVIRLRLDTADAADVNLKLAPPRQLSGTVVIEGDSAKSVAPEGLTVELEPTFGDVPRPRGGALDRDRTFRLDTVFPATFRVSIQPMPENAYVKSVALGGVESRGEKLDLTNAVGSATATVIVSLNGATVQGVVTDDDGKPIRAPLPVVFLRAENPGDGIQGRTDLDAKFRYSGLRPGKYRLIAVHPRQLNSDGNGLEKTLAKIPPFELREGDRVVKDLKLTPLETPDAKH